jgi:hypothetical protein
MFIRQSHDNSHDLGVHVKLNSVNLLHSSYSLGYLFIGHYSNKQPMLFKCFVTLKSNNIGSLSKL